MAFRKGPYFENIVAGGLDWDRLLPFGTLLLLLVLTCGFKGEKKKKEKKCMC